MPSPSNRSAELLLDNVTWIRQLAGQLVSDENDRDDLVQETYVRALQRPPTEVGGFQHWIAKVMRNVARQGARGAGRRRAREERSAPDEELEPTSDVVQRVTMQPELVRDVLEIDEPYRTALLLRYFEGLPPREIAECLRVPIATVHSRQKRALAQLREKLDRDHDGDRSVWVALFLPLADPRHAPTVTTLGAILLNTKLVVLAVTALAVGTVVTLVNTPTSDSPLSNPDAELAIVEDVKSPAGIEAPPAPELEYVDSAREEIAPTPMEAGLVLNQAPELVAPKATLIIGQVLDASGSPLFGFPVRVEGQDTTVVSGDDGRFELETTTQECRLVAASPKWVTVREGFFRAGLFNPVLVVAPAIHLAGEVVSATGFPLADVKVGLQLPDGFDTRFTKILDATHQKSWSTRTNSDGRFELFDVPGVAESQLTFLLDGYQLLQAAAPVQTDRALYFILERPAKPQSGSLSGRVISPSGDPVEAARVVTGLTATLTDENGLFHLDLSRALTPVTIAAVKAGYLPAEMERPFSPDQANSGWPDFVELELGGPPLVLKGRVVDSEGEPVSGSRVWLDNTTRFGTIGIMPTSFENLMAGALVPPETIEAERRLPDADGDSFWKNSTSGAPSSAAWYWKLTDSKGNFEFEGLYDRTYIVNVLDLDTLVSHTSDDLQPGAGVALIELPEPEVFELVQGIVVDQTGRPLEDVRVTLRADPYDESARVFGGTSQLVMTLSREQVTTDAQGRFKFEDVPMSGIRLIFQSDSIVPTNRYLPDYVDAPTAITVEVDARCHVSIELENPASADLFRFQTEKGEHLSIHVISESSHSSFTEGDLVDGKSGVVSVSGRAKQIVLMLGNAEVEVIPINLIPGELNEVRH